MLSTWHSSRHACLAHYRRGHIVHPSQNTSYSVLWSRHQSRLVAQSRTTGDYLRQQTRTGFEARAAPTTDTSCSRCWSQLGVNWDEDLLLLISAGRAGTLGTGFQLKIFYYRLWLLFEQILSIVLGVSEKEHFHYNNLLCVEI